MTRHHLIGEGLLRPVSPDTKTTAELTDAADGARVSFPADGQRAPEDAGDFEWFNGGEFRKEHFND